MTTPIGVFVHDRPEHLKQCLAALERCDQFGKCPVVIYCDAPRTDQSAEGVKEARAYALDWAGKHNGKVIERDRNRGFGNLVDGVSELCDQYGQAIVVEEDVVAAPDFLTFMLAGLEQYSDDRRVWSINGFQFFGAHPPEMSPFFLSTAFATGFATWKGSWSRFEWRPEGWESFCRNQDRRRIFDFDGKWRMSDWFEKAMRGGHACWDPQWAFKIFDRGGVGLFPSQSLVWNCGMGEGMDRQAATEPELLLAYQVFYGDLTAKDFENPRLPKDWSFPEEVAVSPTAYQNMVECFRAERAAQRLLSKGPWYKRLLK